MRKHIALLFAVALLFAGCNKNSNNNPTTPDSFANIHIQIAQFDVTKDGHNGSGGNFYYSIDFVDENGVILKDLQGNSISFSRDRSKAKYAQEKLPNSDIGLAQDFDDIKFKTNTGAKIIAKIKIWDKMSSGNDIEAGNMNNESEYSKLIDIADYISITVNSNSKYQFALSYLIRKM